MRNEWRGDCHANREGAKNNYSEAMHRSAKNRGGVVLVGEKKKRRKIAIRTSKKKRKG